jgi:hypothetical protein
MVPKSCMRLPHTTRERDNKHTRNREGGPTIRDEPPARPALGHVAVLFAFGTRPIDIPLVRRRGLRTHAIVD